jgi:S-formylglutathione hydrolase FrmB
MQLSVQGNLFADNLHFRFRNETKYLKEAERMKPFFVPIILLHFILFFSGAAFAREATILDKTHYSSVLGEVRNYRVFLPPGYDEDPSKRYPVIYFYHGWSQRYFGSINDFKADEGDSNRGDNIANFVAAREVIVVKPDGYNPECSGPLEDYYLRPYNIGPVETYRQFPLYFPELIEHIDATFRTIADRGHRAISGLSMGGFMTFWISGKYPDLVSAAGNFCGSTEFIVGPKDFPVEYRHQDMYKNYGGINVRLNYGDQDFIRAYHADMNKVWTQVMENYEFKIYPAEHSTCGLGEMFSFFMKTFENPPSKPAKWDHTDVYPSFSVWDYQVNSDRNLPGFTILENVDKRGFRCSVRTFLPDGELMPFVNLSVTTPPIYEKNQFYRIYDINPRNGKTSEYLVESNEEGQLKIVMNGGLHEIGINKEKDAPNIVVASFKVENMDWATHNKKINLSVSLLNKGETTAGKITAQLEPTRKSAVVLQSRSAFGPEYSGTKEKIAQSEVPFTFLVTDEGVEIERFKLIIRDNSGNEWNDFIDLRVRVNGPELEDFIIADGKEFAVAAAGDDTVSVFLGNGNGDGIANPGESIVILVNDKGRYFRTYLYTADPRINPSGIHIRESDYWTNYDHVGASAKYSVPVLASESPNDHPVKFFAEYWLPDYPDHIIKRGVISIKIKGKDETPPQLEWVKISGDNTIRAKLLDGGKISTVTARFRLKDEPATSFSVELNVDGEGSDPGYSGFSRKIQEKGFGLYLVEIEAVDASGNQMIKEWPEILVLH